MSAASPASPTAVAGGLVCPRCRAPLLAGKRGWGCSRWREGCGFVVWFETAGRRLTETQLRELLEKGKTRKGKWRPRGTDEVSGRLVLDVDALAGAGAARFEPA